MKLLALVLMLTWGFPAMLAHVPRLGSLIKLIETIDGDVAVYRDAAGCSLIFRGQEVDRVNLATCSA